MGTITYVTGVATETDSGLAAGRFKVRATTVPAETDAGPGAGRAHLRSTGLGPETDAGLPAGRSKARATGLPTETDTALPAGGLPVIVDLPELHGGGWAAPRRLAARPLTKPRTVIVRTGVACETDAGLPATVITMPRRGSPGPPDEDDLLMLGML